jgi:ABC-type lipoprotein release transport system permease subunit
MVGTLAANINDWAYSSGPVVNLAWLRKFANENKELAKVTGLTDMLSSYEYVEVLVDSIDSVLEVQKELREYGVYASSPIEYLDEMKKQIQTMQNFLGFIGAISMLVAALSIANTMMMSIYERTREIGVMKVLGCKLGNIRMLFLAEAAYIGFFGGAIGLVFSYALSWALNNVIWLQEMVAQIMSSNYFGGAGGDVSIIPPELAMGAWALVVGVALCSGLYPAYRAMRLSSLAAIRNAD